LADGVINPKEPALHNQAIMEFGALHCTPKNPKCESCVLQGSCLSYANGTIQMRPIKTKKQEVRNRFFHYLVFNIHGETYIQQRKGRDIWEELYQFPMVETENDTPPAEFKRVYGTSLLEISSPVKHLLSHQRISARFYHVHSSDILPSEDWILIPSSSIQDYPIPRLIDKYLETHSI
jgi:A/G-specific adenine glycosylase